MDNDKQWTVKKVFCGCLPEIETTVKQKTKIQTTPTIREN